jgi:hypothetical protein
VVAVGFQSTRAARKRLAAFCGGAATTRLFLGVEPRISIYVVSNAPLASLTRGWVGFLKHSIFEPGEPQSANALWLFAD